MNCSAKLRKAGMPGACVLLVAACCGTLGAADPNDTYFADSWHHQQIGSQAAWEISPGSPDVIVATIDTGVDANHPDLAGPVIEGWNLVTRSADTSPTSWHGTAVAGVIAAVRDNGRGVAGLADVSIMPIVASPDDTLSTVQASAGIRCATDRGAKVINISASIIHLDELHEAARYAWDHGALVVMANDNVDVFGDQPQWEEIVLVSSSDDSDRRYRSQFGVGLDLLAPGVDIYTTYAEPGQPGVEYYAVGWGASFAAPMVSAGAALAWSINPDLTPAEVQEILFTTAVDLETPGWDFYTGHGRLDLAGVAQAAQDSIPEPGSAAAFLLVGAATLLRRRRARR